MTVELQPRQIRAIKLLARGWSTYATAKEVGVVQKTICSWKQSAEFRERLDQENAAVIASIEDEFKGLLPLSLSTVRDCMSDPEARYSDKLQAVRVVIDVTGAKKTQTMNVTPDEGFKSAVTVGYGTESTPEQKAKDEALVKKVRTELERETEVQLKHLMVNGTWG